MDKYIGFGIDDKKRVASVVQDGENGQIWQA